VQQGDPRRRDRGTRCHAATGIDPCFLDQIALIDGLAHEVARASELGPGAAARAKRHGFSSSSAPCAGCEPVVRGVRHALDIRRLQDRRHLRRRVRGDDALPLLGVRRRERVAPPTARRCDPGFRAEPDGQGVEFDYSCVHASFALRDAGFVTVMCSTATRRPVSDGPTTPQTGLYFEPLTLEDVLEVVHAEQQAGPVAGVIVQLGGQTPLGLAQALKDAGRADRRHDPEAINLARSRGFGRVLAEAGLPARARIALLGPAEAVVVAGESATRSWSGRATCSAAAAWRSLRRRDPVAYVERGPGVDRAPVLVDRSSTTRSRIDVDACTTARRMYLGAVMEHIEEAGIHSVTQPASCHR